MAAVGNGLSTHTQHKGRVGQGSRQWAPGQSNPASGRGGLGAFQKKKRTMLASVCKQKNPTVKKESAQTSVNVVFRTLVLY